MRSRGQEIYTDTNSPFCGADIYAHIHVDYMVRGLTTLVASTHCFFDLIFFNDFNFNEHSFKHCLGSLAGIIKLRCPGDPRVAALPTRDFQFFLVKIIFPLWQWSGFHSKVSCHPSGAF